jgi:hypothetical protein
MDAIINGKGLGPEFLDAAQHWVNRVANPSIYKAFTQVEKMGQAGRGNAAFAYLSGNFNSMLKQFPSFFIFLQEVNPAELLAGLNDITFNHKETTELIHRLSPQMKHRAIERELEEFKRLNPVQYKRIIQKVGQAGMKGIMAIDHIATHAGWKAVYDKHIRAGKPQQEAAELAEKAVMRTQPAAHAKDIPDLYATNEFLNWFLQFTNQQNKIWNMITWDIPADIRGGRYGDAFRAMVGVLLSQSLIFLLSGGLANRKQSGKKGVAQTVRLIPLFGPVIATGIEGWYGAPTPALGGPAAVGKGIGRLFSENPQKAFEDFVEAAAVFYGIPWAQPRRTIKGAIELIDGKTGNPLRLLYGEGVLGKDKPPATNSRFGGSGASRFSGKPSGSRFSGRGGSRFGR